MSKKIIFIIVLFLICLKNLVGNFNEILDLSLDINEEFIEEENSTDINDDNQISEGIYEKVRVYLWGFDNDLYKYFLNKFNEKKDVKVLNEEWSNKNFFSKYEVFTHLNRMRLLNFSFYFIEYYYSKETKLHCFSLYDNIKSVFTVAYLNFDYVKNYAFQELYSYITNVNLNKDPIIKYGIKGYIENYSDFSYFKINKLYLKDYNIFLKDPNYTNFFVFRILLNNLKVSLFYNIPLTLIITGLGVSNLVINYYLDKIYMPQIQRGIYDKKMIDTLTYSSIITSVFFYTHLVGLVVGISIPIIVSSYRLTVRL